MFLNGKTLAGTNVWRSQLLDGRCPTCQLAVKEQRESERRGRALRQNLVQLLGGERPFREFTFEQYETTPGNRRAYERAEDFNPKSENLYLWGACGVGKTHLAYAAARRFFERGYTVEILKSSQLARRVRMKPPEEEQAVIDQFSRAGIFVLDDLGMGTDTLYSRQILQEILDGRDFKDQGGLVITSKYNLGDLAAKINDDTISSRLAGMCEIIEIKGSDVRVYRRAGGPS